MIGNSLDRFILDMKTSWGPLSLEVVAASQAHLELLAKASKDETWLAELLETAPANEELYRDPVYGFILMAHTETLGLYRPPHDHGRSWVIYIVQSGETEMRTYTRIKDQNGNIKLALRNTTLVCAGQAMVYLPGDIHDTRCISETALLYRFTERDLRKEDKEDNRVMRYLERDGFWTI
jgi:hypothetical protein